MMPISKRVCLLVCDFRPTLSPSIKHLYPHLHHERGLKSNPYTFSPQIPLSKIGKDLLAATMASNGAPASTSPSNPPAPPTDSSTPWSVASVLSTLPSPPPTNPTSRLPFFHLLSRLKTTPREGWRRFGIHDGESIADHMYRMSILTMLCPPSLASRLNISHCTKMALVHDMAEAIVGDITPRDTVTKEEKSRREATTMDYLTGGLLGSVQGAGEASQGLKDVWKEYEDGETLESRFVHDIDKIELLLQMMEYERQFNGTKDLSEFTGAIKSVKLPEMIGWAEEILDEREEFWRSVGQPEVGKKRPKKQAGVNGV